MSTRLTFEKAEQIRELRRRGVPVAQICRDFDTSANTVFAIQNGSRFRAPPKLPIVWEFNGEKKDNE